jgi:Trp operon repressor
MKPQTFEVENKNKRNIKRAAYINYLLRSRGYSQTKMANELNVSTACICRVINGIAKSKRVDNWLRENLGI